MSTENQNIDNQEIDLGSLFSKTADFFNNLILKGFTFLKKNGLMLLGLFVVGVVIGFILDIKSKSYVSEIVVNTNHTGNEYLYSKVEELNNELKSDDKKNGADLNPKIVSKIEIEPIIDVYSFVNNQAVANNAQNSQNFEMIKLLSESSDINKVIEDEMTSKNFYYQKVNIYSSEKISEKEVNKALKFLNKDSYFDSIKNLNLQNISKRITQNDTILKQIDLLIEGYKRSLDRGSSSLIKSENSEVGQLISQKRDLLNQIAQDKLSLVSQTKLVKDYTIVLNSENTKGLSNKRKIILPFLLIVLFLGYKTLSSLNKKLKNN